MASDQLRCPTCGRRGLGRRGFPLRDLPHASRREYGGVVPSLADSGHSAWHDKEEVMPTDAPDSLPMRHVLDQGATATLHREEVTPDALREEVEKERDDFKIQAEAQSDRNEDLEKALAEYREKLPPLADAHWVNIVVRRNGKDEVYQADWLKALAPEVKP